MSQLISRGFLQGLSINKDSLPKSDGISFVVTYKEYRYNIYFAFFQQYHEQNDMKHKYSLHVRSLRNMKMFHSSGLVSDIITDLEKINICYQCQIPVTDADLCINCMLRNCFTFSDHLHVDDCPICTDKLLGPRNSIFSTPCGHIFHRDCFLKTKVKDRVHIHMHDEDNDDDGEIIMQEIRECPTCKSDVTDREDYGH
jgi:hypothetical protein